MKNRKILVSALLLAIMTVLLVACDGSIEIPSTPEGGFGDGEPIEQPEEVVQPTEVQPTSEPIIVVVPDNSQPVETAPTETETTIEQSFLIAMFCGILLILVAVIYFGNRRASKESQDAPPPPPPPSSETDNQA